MSTNDRFSRERRAGYDPHKLFDGHVLVVGGGAAGNSIALNIALSGVGFLTIVDPDTVDLSNLARSPLFALGRQGARVRFKAREAAQALHRFAFAPEPVLRYLVGRVEELGLGVLARADVVVSAVDSLRVRAHLADVCMLVGVPLIEVGFSPPWIHVSVHTHRVPSDACFRCLHPEVQHGGISCSLYAARVVADGGLPATQACAAAVGSLAAEATIQALHGNVPLAGCMLHLNIQTGETRRVEITRDPACPGPHRVLGPVEVLPHGTTDPLARVFEALDPNAPLRALLPLPLLVSAPCARCGRTRPVFTPACLVTTPPACRRCPREAPASEPPVVVTEVPAGSALAELPCQRLGLPPFARFEVVNDETGEVRTVELAGSFDDVFRTTTARRV